jgi:hypothetical protein
MLDAAGKAHPVVGKGKVFIQLPDREIKCIDNVLYVLGVHRNLLSVGCIANQGYTLEFINPLVSYVICIQGKFLPKQRGWAIVGYISSKPKVLLTLPFVL